jgi:hypothetical protein
VKLTKVVETIIADDSGDLLQKCIADFEGEKDALQRAVDLNAEDYDLVVAGNKNLLLSVTN